MSLPKNQITIPKFRTEGEEADWWDAHPGVASEIMRRAIKSGKARRPVPLKTVTMRLPVPDIKAAQDLAHEKGLPYQTYIKMLLHEALKKERFCLIASAGTLVESGCHNRRGCTPMRRRFPVSPGSPT
jgi:hypothetical protein